MGLSSGNSLASLAEGGGASGVSASQVSKLKVNMNLLQQLIKKLMLVNG